MNAIYRKIISINLIKLVLPLFVLLFVQAVANAQSYTPEEQNCYNQVQNRVAWNTEGKNVWGEDNARNLCRGATDTYVRIKCFAQNMPQLGWQKATEKCTAPATDPNLSGQPAFDLNGTWAMFEGNGKPYEKNATISQNGASITLNNGYGSQVTENLEGSKLSARAWRLTGTLSADGKRIDWSNGFYWTKKDLWSRPEIDATSEVNPATTAAKSGSTVTLKNNGDVVAYLKVYRADNPFDNTAIATVGYASRGQSLSSAASLPPKTPLEIEITMQVGFWYKSQGSLPIYRATVLQDVLTDYCFEVTGNVYTPSVKPCNNTQAVEAKYVGFKNDAGFAARVTLDYIQQASDGSRTSQTFTTDDTVLGFNRKIYLPRDAAPDREITLNILGTATATNSPNLFSTKIERNKKTSDCYKVWGIGTTPKVSPCSLDPSARKITLKNNGAYDVQLFVTYFDKDSNGGDVAKTVNSNIFHFGSEESIAVPQGTSDRPVEINIHYTPITTDDFSKVPQFPTIKALGKFTGELCYRTEGTAVAGAGSVSNCDNSVGDMLGETRQIRFQNEAGFDAELVVVYWEDEKVGTSIVPVPKTLTTGMINGLGGKYRLATIPIKTSKGHKVYVYIKGNSTLRNDVFKTELDENFTASPLQCFKTWGTLFDPQGGKCTQ